MDTKEKKRTASTKQNSKPSASAGKTRQSRSDSRSAAGQKKTASGSQRQPAASRQASGNTQRQRPPAAQTRSSTATGQRRTSAAQATRRKTADSRSAAVQTQRRRSRASEPQKEKQPVATPDVVYTPPKPFSRNRFLLHLASVVAVVLALTFGISIFFKVDTVTVSGTQKYTPWIVSEASGIQIGDNLLTFGNAKACGRIKSALPYVDSVRIGIKLPGTVNIEITELDVMYSIKDSQGAWWLITSSGKVVDQVDNASAGEYTKVLGVQLFEPSANQQAVAADVVQEQPAEGESSESTTPVTVRGSDRLLAAQSILQYLEENSILGQVASVDVSDLGNIELWYGTRYQVFLGDTTRLDMKIMRMKQAISQRPEYDQGILDISYTVMPDKIIYKPFQ